MRNRLALLALLVPLALPSPSRAATTFEAPFRTERFVSGCDGPEGTVVGAAFYVCKAGATSAPTGDAATETSIDTGLNGTLRRITTFDPTNYAEARSYLVYKPASPGPLMIRLHIARAGSVSSALGSDVSTANASATVAAFAVCPDYLVGNSSAAPEDVTWSCGVIRVVTPTITGTVVELSVPAEAIRSDGIAIGVVAHTFVRLGSTEVMMYPGPSVCTPLDNPLPPREGDKLCAPVHAIEAVDQMQGVVRAAADVSLRAIEVLPSA